MARRLFLSEGFRKLTRTHRAREARSRRDSPVAGDSSGPVLMPETVLGLEKRVNWGFLGRTETGQSTRQIMARNYHGTRSGRIRADFPEPAKSARFPPAPPIAACPEFFKCFPRIANSAPVSRCEYPGNLLALVSAFIPIGMRVRTAALSDRSGRRQMGARQVRPPPP